jgi:hypothetical protein
MLLRVILSAYARGFTSSRQIEQLCKENVVFMALSADSQPHFTTFAKFIAQMSDVIQPLFTEVLMVCDQQGLIGGDMFAIDGCKLPSNASKEIDRAVRRILSKHREEDATGQDNDHTRRAAEETSIASLRAASHKIEELCTAVADRGRISGKVTTDAHTCE